jgi:membrane associated rhomboid family serine protease
MTMKIAWQRFTAALTPGVRIILIMLAIALVATLVGHFTHTVDLPRWLAANPPDFWHGQVWRIVTYALLPASVLSFLMNTFALIMLGSMLERHWTRGELWLFCCVAAAGAGLTSVLLATSSSPPLTGPGPMMFGLLVAWAFISGHETVPLSLFGQMTVGQMVLILAAASFLVTLFSAGLTVALVMSSGGLTGWLYLWLRHKWLMTRAARAFQSERISRLEL